MEKDFIDWAAKELGAELIATKEEYGDQNIVYKLESTNETYFLKIGKGLEKEKERLEWLDGKQPVPNVIGFKKFNNTDGLLLTGLEGKNLKSAAKELGPDKTIELLVAALKQFHSTDIKDCPFGNYSEGHVLVHGDACLPNFIVKDEKLSGYIDLEDMRMGKREVDLAAGVWSLQYNFGAGFGIQFLQKYGIENPTEGMVGDLHKQYEQMMEAWNIK